MFIAAVFTIFLICSNLCPLMGKQWKQFQTLFFGAPKITADGDCSHEIERCLLLGRKVMTNLDSILSSRDITLPTEVLLVKAMVFPVVHHWLNGCEFEWIPGVGDGQGILACCDSWGGKESDMTERLNWTELMPIASVMPSTISSSVVPFSSCLQSFPLSGSFPISQFFTSGSQRIEVSASASVLPMNIPDWFPLGLTGWISLLVQGTLKSLLQHHSSKACHVISAWSAT